MQLIVIDGLDGVGKDTHALLLKEKFEAEGHRVIIRSHPTTDNMWGRKAKKALLGTGKFNMLKASLFYAMDVLRSVRKYHCEDRCDTIIMVRYLGGLAYLPPSLGNVMYRFFTKILPTSSHMFFLDVEPEVSLERIEQRDHREMFETLEQLKKVRRRAKELMGSWHCVDTGCSIAEAHENICRIIEE